MSTVQRRDLERRYPFVSYLIIFDMGGLAQRNFTDITAYNQAFRTSTFNINVHIEKDEPVKEE